MRIEVGLADAAWAVGMSSAAFADASRRGEVPPPRWTEDGKQTWSIVDLATGEGATDRTRQIAQVAIAQTTSRVREWEGATRRWLAQIGIPQADAHVLIGGAVPDAIDSEAHRAARRIIQVRRGLQRHLADAAPILDGVAEQAQIRRAAEAVAEGGGVFEVLADLTIGMTSRGLPEILLPPVHDPRFWAAQGSPDRFAAYLMGLQRVDLPAL